MFISIMSRCMRVKRKVSADYLQKIFVYLDYALALRTVKRRFCRFVNDNFSPNVTIRSWQPLGINNDLIRYLVNRNIQFTTENITKRLNVDNLTAFFHIKQPVYF